VQKAAASPFSSWCSPGVTIWFVLQVPEVVRQKAFAVGADVWLDDLPLLIASLAQEWGIALGAAYSDSTEAFVAEAICEDGTPAVLKLLVSRSGDAAQNEITVLRLTGQRGSYGDPRLTVLCQPAPRRLVARRLHHHDVGGTRSPMLRTCN
jgi:hypothetical protein